jgi:hypothetical protein
VGFHHLVEREVAALGQRGKDRPDGPIGQGAVIDLPPGGCGLEQAKALEGGESGACALSQANDGKSAGSDSAAAQRKALNFTRLDGQLGPAGDNVGASEEGPSGGDGDHRQPAVRHLAA